VSAPAPTEAWVALVIEPHENMEIDGNARGLERLAEILHRCADDSPEGREYRSAGGASADLRQLLRGADLTIAAINLLEQPRSSPWERSPGWGWWGEKLALLGCGLLLFLVGGIFLAGLDDLFDLIRG
jgi:hypothetical protein